MVSRKFVFFLALFLIAGVGLYVAFRMLVFTLKLLVVLSILGTLLYFALKFLFRREFGRKTPKE